MAYKTNSLFHFTSEMDTIISILEYGFIPFYGKEDIDDLFGDETDLFEKEMIFDVGSNTFPMICLCDIPLTSISDHTNTYGSFALGMKQSWGLRNGFTPLIYYSDKMPIFKEIQTLAKLHVESKEYSIRQNTVDMHSIYGNVTSLNFIGLLKTYFKPMIQKKDGEIRRFYLENEWRYIPDKDEYESKTKLPLFIFEDHKQSNNKKIYSNLDDAFSIAVHVSDIEYIIVKEKQQIPILITKIREWASKRNYSQENIDLLLTKIISLSHINADF